MIQEEPLEILISEDIEPSGIVDLRHLFTYDYESYAKKSQGLGQTATPASSSLEAMPVSAIAPILPVPPIVGNEPPRESVLWKIFGVFCLLAISAFAGAYYNGWIEFSRPAELQSDPIPIALHKEPEIIPEPQIQSEETKTITLSISEEPIPLKTSLEEPKFSNLIDSEATLTKTVDEIFQEGLLFEQEKRYTEALQKYQDVLRIDPSYSKAYYRMGYVYHITGDRSNASLRYQQAIETDPNLFQAYNNLGILYLEDNNLSSAHHHFSQAITLQPNSAEAYNNFANTLKKMGNYDEAIHSYQKALQLRSDLYDATWNLALIYFHQQQYQQSRDILLPLLSQNEVSFSAEIYNLLGKISNQEEKLEEANSHYEKALAIQPGFLDAMNNLGITFTKQERYPEAIQKYQQILEQDPQYDKAYNNLGIVYAKQNQWAQAISNYQKAIQLNPNYADAYYNYGVALEEQSQFKEAHQQYVACLKRDKKHYRACNNIGQLYIRWDIEPERALKWIEKSLEIQPNFPEAHLNHGWILSKLKQYKESGEAFERYLKLSPDKNNEFVKQALEKIKQYQIQKNHQEALKNYLKILQNRNAKSASPEKPNDSPPKDSKKIR